jgi:hypothetical protein
MLYKLVLSIKIIFLLFKEFYFWLEQSIDKDPFLSLSDLELLIIEAVSSL